MSQSSIFVKNHYAIILAAGHSSRMGTSKWNLKMPSGKSFLYYIAGKYLEMDIPVVVVVNEGERKRLYDLDLPENMMMAVNPHPEKGRFFSLQCGLKLLDEPVPCFIHNIDNPFVRGDLLTDLVSRIDDYQFVMPVYEKKGGHPVLVNKQIAEAALACSNPFPVLRDFLKQYKGYRMEYPDKRILLNINHPEAYREFLESTP